MKDIISAVYKYRMFGPGERVLVAVSGGPDSIAMLHALYTSRTDLEIQLHAAHLNHSIRAQASDQDEAFVEAFTRELGIPFTSAKANVPLLAEEKRMGIEEAAREARYEFLEMTAKKIGADKIAVGHNADDRAESVLMNIIRGSGIHGLGSIRPVRNNVVRPLICTPRADIEEYIRSNGLGSRQDMTNFDTEYLRNRIRHELLPVLERDYNPAICEGLVRLADLASDTSDFISLAAAAELRASTYQGNTDAEMLSNAPDALLNEIIRKEIQCSRGSLKDVSAEVIFRVADMLRLGGDFKITLPSGDIYAERRGKIFKVYRDTAADPLLFNVALNIPGTTNIFVAGIELRVDILRRDSLKSMITGADESLIDMNSISGNLKARSFAPGDRIHPMGMPGTKKLQDVFTDKKIPRRLRARQVVIADDCNILCVVGVITSEVARIEKNTVNILRIEKSDKE